MARKVIRDDLREKERKITNTRRSFTSVALQVLKRKKRRRIANYEGKRDERCRCDRNREILRAKKGRKHDTGDRKPDRNPMTR